MSDKRNYADLSLRLGLGLLFLAAGLTKLFVFKPTGFAVELSWLGFLALFAAWMVTLIEVFGGLALILNKFVKWTSGLLTIIMVVAIITVVLPRMAERGFVSLAEHLAFLGGLVSLLISNWNVKV